MNFIAISPQREIKIWFYAGGKYENKVHVFGGEGNNFYIYIYLMEL